ncbi:MULTISPECIES: hypothetical protein [unclassified Blastococcus]
MDAAAVPWAVLGVVLLALAALAAVPARRRRPGAGSDAGRPAPGALPDAPPPASPPPAFPDDDLPAFAATPPGTPGAAPPPESPARVRVAAAGTGADGGPPPGRVLLAMTAAALALLAVLALLAGAARGTREDSGAPADATTAGAPPPSPPAPLPVPDLPPVPPEPVPGQPGAGTLAAVSVPPDAGGWAARLAFAPLVLERRAVGVTVAAAAVGVTSRADGTALAHVRLPTWNCLATEAPTDPAAAGCVPGPVEYADLPSPALRATAEDGGLRLTGRFPTYTRPAGGPPLYTGRVYELTVTLSAGEPVDAGGWAPARGTLFLGTDRAAALEDAGVSAVRRGG